MAYNPLYRLKGTLDKKSKKPGGGASLGDKKEISSNDLEHLKSNLIDVKSFFESRQDYLTGALVDAHYYRVISKSRRIAFIFPQAKFGNIVGIRFSNDDSERHHIITYFLSFDVIDKSIGKIQKTIDFLNLNYEGRINKTQFEKLQKDKRYSDITKVLIDASNVKEFKHPNFQAEEINDFNIVTFYQVNNDPSVTLTKLGIIKSSENTILDKNTFVLSRSDLEYCINKASYLISMAVDRVTEFSFSNQDEKEEKTHIIPSPKNEPTIGVIDTLFDERAYFKDWVDVRHTITKINPSIEDKIHATKVASIIVDGPELNPKLNDNCGRFKVRLFEVALNGKNNNLEILSKIEEIVKDNSDIHVWNLSLGSDFPISNNFISPEAFSLDKLQSKYNVVFVIAATNENNVGKSLSKKRIGSPADSINSIVVGSCNFKKEPASYSRKGGVLSFFIKPDVLYYGGDYEDEPIRTNNGFKDCDSQGTSFAAPWIARKLCYLIDVLHFDRETAKALIIDSAIGWDPMPNYHESTYKGYGVVPIDISDIVNSKTDEIKFYFHDVIKTYSTGTLMIPVPVNEDNKTPFNIKATLCYFCDCNRNQGVDYTMTEMDLGIGVVSGGTIKSINKNTQSDDDGYVLEEYARDYFRKWDSVKHVSEKISKIAKKLYETNRYGFRIFTKERFYNDGKYGYNFALVITLKEQKGLNRSDQFVRECQSSGWIVTPISIEDNVNVYVEAQDDIKLE